MTELTIGQTRLTLTEGDITAADTEAIVNAANSRSFPGGGRCGYYDFLSFERRAQDDPEFVALTNHEP